MKESKSPYELEQVPSLKIFQSENNLIKMQVSTTGNP